MGFNSGFKGLNPDIHTAVRMYVST